jgi:hypothetical protein
MRNELLVASLELLLEDWQYNLSKIYTLQTKANDPLEAASHQKEIDRRTRAINVLEALITEAKQ